MNTPTKEITTMMNAINTTATNPHTARLLSINAELDALQLHFNHGIESQQDAQRAVDDIRAAIRDAEQSAAATAQAVGAAEVAAELGRGDAAAVTVAIEQAGAAVKALAKARLREADAQRNEGRVSQYAAVVAEMAAELEALRTERADLNVQALRHFVDQDLRTYSAQAAAIGRTIARLTLMSEAIDGTGTPSGLPVGLAQHLWLPTLSGAPGTGPGMPLLSFEIAMNHRTEQRAALHAELSAAGF